MDKKEESEKEGCCSGHGGCGCCGGRAIKTLIIFLLGGIIGYLAGSRCPYMHGTCPYATTSPQPTTPSK
jgi:hypothetical protein